MGDRLKQFNYIFNSEDRLVSSTNSSPSFHMKDRNGLNSVSIRVRKVVIPFTYYVVNEQNRYLDITYGATTGSENSYTITMPIGSYSIDDFIAQFNIITESILTDIAIVKLNSFPFTGLVNISSSSYKFALLFGSGSHAGMDMHRLLGFDPVDVTPTHTVNSAYPVDMLDRLNTINVNWNLGEHMYSSKEGGMIPCIERVPVNHYNFGDLISYESNTLSAIYLDDWSAISTISFSLVDERDSSVIDLNGHPWSIELLVNEL